MLLRRRETADDACSPWSRRARHANSRRGYERQSAFTTGQCTRNSAAVQRAVHTDWTRSVVVVVVVVVVVLVVYDAMRLPKLIMAAVVEPVGRKANRSEASFTHVFTSRTRYVFVGL